MIFKKNTFAILLVLLILLVLSACGGDSNYYDEYEYEEYVDEPTPPALNDGTPYFPARVVESPLEFLPFIIPAGPVSRLTGLPIYEENLNRRPFAAVINNHTQSLPQSGLAWADVVYEVLAEGDITRLVGIFQSYIPEKIGPMRSARDYFVDFAFNHDALFIHHGSSPGGYSRIWSLGLTNLDGMALEGSVFWRDRSFPEWALNTGNRPFEHSSFTGGERLLAHIENRAIRDYWPEEPQEFGFNFHAHRGLQGELTGGQAYNVVVPFSNWYYRRFVYCHETELYFLENRHGAHMEAETGEQIAVGNILIQFTSMRVVDAEGRQNVYTIGTGAGYLVSGGRFQAVNWAKDSHTAPTRWYFEDGSPLVMAPGRVWICVFQAHGDVFFE